jgi:hypothetical protein
MSLTMRTSRLRCLASNSPSDPIITDRPHATRPGTERSIILSGSRATTEAQRTKACWERDRANCRSNNASAVCVSNS